VKERRVVTMDRKPDEIYCPNCAKPVNKEAVMCPYCKFQIKELKVSGGDMVLKSYEKTSAGANYLFKTDIEVLANYIQKFFKAEGYDLKEGTPVKGGYIKGSLGMRLILGGFVDRYKFDVSITEKDGMVHLMLSKGMTGASGGLVGYKKMEDEVERIREKLYNKFLHK
jgi:hypothetical protein